MRLILAGLITAAAFDAGVFVWPGLASEVHARPKLEQIPIGAAERIGLRSKGIFPLTRDTPSMRSICTTPVMENPAGFGRLPFRVTGIEDSGRITVSRRGRWALTNQTDRWKADIMLVDKYR